MPLATFNKCYQRQRDKEEVRRQAPRRRSSIRVPLANCSHKRGDRCRDATRCLQCGRVDMICGLFGNSRNAVRMQRSPNFALRLLTLS